MARLNRPSLMVYGGTIRAGHALGQAARHHLGVPVVRRVPRRRHHRRAAARHRPARLSGRGRLRRHVHRQHDGGGDRGARPVAAVQLVAAGRGSGQGGRVPPRRRRGAAAARARPQAARHPDAASRSRTRWRWSWRSADRPTPCCTCWRSPRRRGVPLSLDDFQRASDRVPLLADLKPSGQYVQEDLHAVGGTPAVMKYLLERGLPARRLHDGDREDAGREPGGRCRRSPPGQQIIQPIETAGAAARSHPHPARQPRARRRGREDHRQGRRAVRRPGARSTTRKRRCSPGSSAARSRRARSS